MKTEKIIANFVLNDLTGMLKKRSIPIEECPVKPQVIGFLARRVAEGRLTRQRMRQLVAKWIDQPQEPQPAIAP